MNVEAQKLLVPTPQVGFDNGTYNGTDMNNDGTIDSVDMQLATEEYKRINWVSGIFRSFGDAPGGFSEELREVSYSVGAEYNYQDAFAMRLGYFNESKDKGGRKFFTLGAGFKYNIVRVDVSYLFSASRIRNPLENTLRFSLTFNFGDKYEDY
ncbi:MAG: PorV/PorQ family protein [Flavobacterium sp.]